MSAVCGALSAALSWHESGASPPTDERSALSAIRAHAAGGGISTGEQLRRACTKVYPATAAATPPLAELRSAVLIAAQVVERFRSGDKIDDESWRAWERLFLTHLINSGEGLGVRDAAVKARTAMDDARRDRQAPAAFPEPEYARARALGFVISNLRRRGKLEQPDLCRLAASRGAAKMTGARLARLEAGNPWRDAPVDVIAECLGQTGEELRERGDIAHRFAQALAARAGVTDPERWYAELVSTDGANTADHYLGVGASTAVRLTIEQLRRVK